MRWPQICVIVIYALELVCVGLLQVLDKNGDHDVVTTAAGILIMVLLLHAGVFWSGG